ncbi:non-ribosomal peptide synthetase [Ralstonia pseudosolanacearum]|uniref:non-ribosomal peptide synthetase n=1 Tax=Ralstonia pseudosolanacearum TaxID=1310165 RepID=UPI001FFAA95B|nr:non-ribosomal peptide synthetase [Ralstonia pseudosolanacearum]
MHTVSTQLQDESRLQRAAHYQRLFDGQWLPANLAPMPGYPSEPEPVALEMSALAFHALLKITRGDEQNIGALLSVGLNLLTHYYAPADYPLCFGYSIAGGGRVSHFVLQHAASAPEHSVAEAMVQHRQQILEVLKLGDGSFEEIRLLLDHQGPRPLFGIHLCLRAAGQPPLTRQAGTLQFDFDLSAEGRVSLHADAALYPAPYRWSILRNFVGLLEQIALRPKHAISELEWCCEVEQAIAEGFAQGETRTFSTDLRLEQMLEARAAGMPRQLAVICEDERLDYQTLNARANVIAWNLIDKGVRPGQAVAVMLPRGAGMLAAIYGVLKAGACYVPVDPNYPENRRSYILEDSQAHFVIVETAEGVPSGFAERALPLSGFAETTQGTRNPSASQDAGALAYLIYTSGSTGNPKGVMIEHRSVFNRIEWMQHAYALQPGDVILQKTPISFDVSVWELFWWAFVGATVSLLRPNGEKEPETMLAAIARDGVTHMHFVPSMLDAFLQSIDAGAEQARTLKTVFTSGEALTLHQSERFFAQIGQPWGTRLVNLYGPTEATVDVTAYECRPAERRASVPIGRPIQNTGILILDAQRRRTPIGVPGELCISGVNLARGYLNRPELTAEKFCELPAPIAQRVYRTGDLVRWLADGQIEYLGRIDHQVKIRGYRIELGEIETAIQRCPHVRDVRVIALAREDGSKFLAAYVQPGEGYDEQQVRTTLLGNLPEFMVPPYFVVVEHFPLTPNGKLDRARLPNPQKTAGPSSRVLPSTDLEKALAAIWSDVLGVEPVGIHDSFFSLGGDSITSLGVISRTRKLGFEISFQQMFSHPTIAGIIPLLERVQAVQEEAYQPFSLLSEADRSKLPQHIDDAYPLSQLQAGLIFQSELNKGASWYHDIQVYTLDGRFQAEAFREATRRMVAEHAILRTSYHLQGYETFVQIVHSDTPLPLFIEDWGALDAQQQAQRLEQFIEQESHYRFDWQQPGLIRIHIQVLSQQQFRYILSFHDSALDGWSINQLHTKLLRYYHLACQGDIPAQTFHDDFLRRYVAIEQATRQDPAAREYWRTALHDYEPMPLPRLRTRQGDVPVIDYHDVEIPPALSDALRALAGRLGVPVKTVLLSAHMRVLGLLTNTRAVVSGYEHSGRPEEAQVDQAIGLFLNSIPLLTRLQPDESWSALIRRIHAQEAAFLPYRRFPMADMKAQLQTTQTLFEAVFNFTHFHMLKELRALPGMNALNVRVRAETEFALRAEFSQNAYTDQVQFSLHYHSNEFDAEHIARIGAYYLNALRAMAGDAEQPYLRIDLIPDAEKARLAELGRGAERPLPPHTAIHLMLEQAQRHPQRIALRDADGALSFGDFAQAVRAVASGLPGRGEAPVVVAIALPRSVAWITTIAGVMAAGAVYMPLEADNPDARILELLSEAKVSHLVCDARQQARFAELLQRHDAPVRLHVHGEPAVSGEGFCLPEMDDLAYVLFTSGSTGKPKGAMLEHRGMLNHMLAKIEDLQMGAEDVLAQTAPVTFDVSVWQALTGLACGAQTVVYAKDVQLDPAGFCARLKQDGVSVLEIVPSYFALLLDYLEAHPTDLGALRVLLQTGEALKHELVVRWFALYPHIRLVNAYGPTEASDDITHHTLTVPPADAIVPIGRPIRNMWVHILDEQDRLVPLGTPGEICVSGIGVGRGYINAPDKTLAAFDFAHPLGQWSSGRLYRTGDIGKWRADGDLAYLGRKDEQVKIRGMRIEIGEIENALLSVEHVQNAAVVLQPGEPGGYLIGVVQGQADPSQVQRQIAQRLPDFMLPEHILRCDTLPLNAAGKVDKKALLAWCGPQVRPDQKAVQPPVTALERELADQWASLLKVAPQAIGRDSSFFALGGNSLLAMSAAMRSQGRFTIVDLFAHKTLARLAAHIEGGRQSEQRILQRLDASGQGPALVCFSYAGGNAVNFQGVADALQGRLDLRVFAAEPPGNDPSRSEPLLPPVQLAQRCVEELRQAGVREVVAWGHCSGCGPAVAFAAQAVAAGLQVRTVVLSGKVLRPEDILRQQMELAAAMSDTEILQWLVDVTGLDLSLDGDADVQARLARAYRNDAMGANEILLKIWQGTLAFDSPLRVLCLLAEDDPLTRGSEALAENWKRLNADLQVRRLPDGGHYFLKTRIPLLSDMLCEALTQV